MANEMFDVIVIGGGPAGLSAALLLGRCRRRVLVCDAGTPRNARSKALNGFLSRDGTPPAEFLDTARQQVLAYSSVEILEMPVTDAKQTDNGFAVFFRDGSCRTAHKLVVATGVVDELPPISGIDQFYGRSVYPCPYCDAWEWRDQPLAAYGEDEKGAGLSLMLSLWSKDVVLLSNGPARLSQQIQERLTSTGILVREEPISRLEGTDGRLEQIIFANGDLLPRRALFFNTGEHQQSDLLKKLGCHFDQDGRAHTGRFEEANVPGLYIVGDASGDLQFAIIAAAKGARAAVAINKAMLRDAGLTLDR